MSAKIRILAAANKHMQRLGFLKRLAHESTRKETSNLESLAAPLVNAVMKRVRLAPPYETHLRDYVQHRLRDATYANIRHAIISDPPTEAAVELQDLYLSDPRIPSTTGKLNDGSREKYPYLATALELIKPGTWSAMTRSLTLLALVTREELDAFDEFSPKYNPLLLSREQAALLLYCLVDNDAEILFRLFEQLAQTPNGLFDERTAGDMLPDIIRKTVTAFSKSSLPIEDRERLAHLEKVAGTIERYRNRNYSGTTAREVSIRVRLEPFCDVGFFKKPDRHRFTYQLTPAFHRFMDSWSSLEATDAILRGKFLRTLAGIHGLKSVNANEEEARSALKTAGEELQSTLGYTPITDCSLLAGIRLLFSENKILEPDRSYETLRAWQKESPESVRFTVDRMGELAYVKWVKSAASIASAKQ
jgi:hypothetical protein